MMLVEDDVRKDLADLLEKACAQRLELDGTLGEIESIVGVDLDGLDEAVGNGCDVDTLLQMADEALEEQS